MATLSSLLGGGGGAIVQIVVGSGLQTATLSSGSEPYKNYFTVDVTAAGISDATKCLVLIDGNVVGRTEPEAVALLGKMNSATQLQIGHNCSNTTPDVTYQYTIVEYA